MTEKPRRLGRGLEALLAARESPAERPTPPDGGVRQIPIASISPNPYQPRKEFRPDELAELESSLKASGLLQPVTIRPLATTTDRFELVAGERRLRAATRLGWNEIPAIVRELDDQALLTLALVENLQRADLNPIDEAEGYRRLVDEFHLTQMQVADAVGKERSTVANTLRLLNLPQAVRQLVAGGQLSTGHARALLALPTERAILDLANETIARRLTVRDVEQRIRDIQTPPTQHIPASKPESSKQTPEVRRIADALRKHLQTDVTLSVRGKDRGDIRISFYSPDDLERILDLVLPPAVRDA